VSVMVVSTVRLGSSGFGVDRSRCRSWVGFHGLVGRRFATEVWSDGYAPFGPGAWRSAELRDGSELGENPGEASGPGPVGGES
jgi:hypothetical protein